jgi:AcrR family transcriptional regulator
MRMVDAMSQQKTPKFRRRAEARPDEVLDAALALFAAQGFARTSVEAVARAAGLSKAAVYLYFPSKRALLAGLIRRAVAPVAELALAPVQGDPRPVLAALLRGAAARLAQPGVLAIPTLVLREAAVAPEIAQLYRDEVLDRVLPALRQILIQGMDEGHLRPLDPDLTLRSLIGPLLVHVILAQVFGIQPPGGLGLEALVENHLTILLAGLSPDGGRP